MLHSLSTPDIPGALMKTFPLLLALACLLSACTSNYTWSDPKVDLTKRKFYFVEAELADGKNLHQAIASELRTLGYDSDSGYLTLIPSKADTVVSYQSRWTWDFTTYLIELNIQVRDVASGRILASSGYHRPALKGTSTEEVIRTTVAAIFPPRLKDAAKPGTPKAQN